jgi:Transcription factor WhiB
LTGVINMSLNSRRYIYVSVFTGVQLPCPISKGAFPMPDDTAIPDTAGLLSPQILQQTVADTRRRWSVHALCATTDPEIFFPPTGSLATEARAICAQCPVRRSCLVQHESAPPERYGSYITHMPAFALQAGMGTMASRDFRFLAPGHMKLRPHRSSADRNTFLAQH